MGRIAEVISIDGREVKVDAEDSSTPEHFADPGDDSLPLPGDHAAVEEGEGSGGEQATGYSDKNAGNLKSAPGEKRLYARSSDGVLVGEAWLKGDGSILLKSLLLPTGASIEIKPDGKIKMGLVEIDTVTGIIKCVDTVLGSLSMLTHVHISAAPTVPTGPAISPPTPP